MRIAALALSTFFISQAALAQSTVTFRDVIKALPLISICQDGATHATVATEQRLRPNGFKLAGFVGQAVEVTGIPGAVTCKYLDVTAIKAIKAAQSSKTSSGAQLTVEFYGAPIGVYAVYFGALGNSSFTLPGITGPIHLDPVVNIPLGLYAPASTSVPYLKLSTPSNPSLLGVNFFTQAVVTGAGSAEMSNVDVFSF